jgi:hypothetical protein
MPLLSHQRADNLFQSIGTSRRSNALSIAVPPPFSQLLISLAPQSRIIKLLTPSFQTEEQVESVQVTTHTPTTLDISTTAFQ